MFIIKPSSFKLANTLNHTKAAAELRRFKQEYLNITVDHIQYEFALEFYQSLCAVYYDRSTNHSFIYFFEEFMKLDFILEEHRVNLKKRQQ